MKKRAPLLADAASVRLHQAPTTAEQALNPPMPGTVAPPPPCRVDHEATDGDDLGVAGGAVVLDVGGHTPGSIALHLPSLGVLLTGDLVAESRGNVIVAPFDTDRDQSRRSISLLADTGARIAGFGHREPVTSDAATGWHTAPTPRVARPLLRAAMVWRSPDLPGLDEERRGHRCRATRHPRPGPAVDRPVDHPQPAGAGGRPRVCAHPRSG